MNRHLALPTVLVAVTAAAPVLVPLMVLAAVLWLGRRMDAAWDCDGDDCGFVLITCGGQQP